MDNRKEVENISGHALCQPLKEIESPMRRKIIKEALSWIPTPYVDGQGMKHAGVDCAYFPLRICQSIGIASPAFRPPRYSPQAWLNSPSQVDKKHLRFEDRTMFDIVIKLAKAELRSPYTDAPSSGLPIIDRDPLPADFVLYKVVASWTHLAFIVKWPEYVLHPLKYLGVIGSHGTDEGFWQRSPRRFFTILGENE